MADSKKANQALALGFALFFDYSPNTRLTCFVQNLSAVLSAKIKMSQGFVIQRLSGCGDLMAALDHCNVTHR
jgi:hypothetical protein